MKVFFDIDTQLDFMTPGGALYGPGAERLLPSIAALNAWAGRHRIPLISTADAHPENAAEFRTWPPHCVAGTFGQRKPAATLLANHAVLPWDPEFNLASLDAAASQIVVEKNDLDAFSNPHFPALLETIGAQECYVYGVFIDYCVKCAIMGLVQSGRKVFLVADAAASISTDAGDQVVRDFLGQGGSLITMAEVIGG